MHTTYLQKHVSLACGDVYLIASAKGLVGVTTQDKPCDGDNPNHTQHAGILQQAAQELREYFGKTRTTFTVTLDVLGTSFQKKVWEQLLQIPYGTTISYKELAIRVGNVNAARAVGAANGKNPLWIIIPCHRVIQSNGSLGGYAGGNTVKEYLLELEKNN